MKKYIIDFTNLMEEWNCDKNKDVDPKNVSYGSNIYVCWKCKKCKQEWKSKVSSRTILQRGCPYCTNKKIKIGFNDLNSLFPALSKEWHPIKNLDLKPTMVSIGSGKKVWWKCPVGHEYQATILHRTYGTNCPICNSGRQTSFAEQAVYFYVKKLYPDAISRFKAPFLKNMELDIYIPSIRYAIEYDGEAWHKENNLEREQRKYKICNQNNIKLVRLREKRAPLCSDITDWQLSCNKMYEHQNLQNIIKELIKRINFKTFHCSIDVNIERDQFLIQSYKTEIKNSSLEQLFPNIAKEWHPTKNLDLKPTMFKPYSDHKVWWKCSTCNNAYFASIGHRVYGCGCPKCGIVKSAIKRGKMVLNVEKNIIYSTISQAARELGLNSANITSCCKNKRELCGGYHWKYID